MPPDHQLKLHTALQERQGIWVSVGGWPQDLIKSRGQSIWNHRVASAICKCDCSNFHHWHLRWPDTGLRTTAKTVPLTWHCRKQKDQDIVDLTVHYRVMTYSRTRHQTQQTWTVDSAADCLLPQEVPWTSDRSRAPQEVVVTDRSR